jgi:hypothetical protein
MESPNLRANGAINPCCFVKLDPTEDNACLQATTGTFPIGISQEGTQLFNVTQAATQAGDQMALFGLGHICLLVYGGTVTSGDLLKPDANGNGVTAAVGSGSYYGAIALESGSSGVKGRVQVMMGKA